MAKRNQIFLTTHSLEFVDNLLYYAKEREDVDVKVIGFYELIDGKLDYEIYNEKQAYTIVNKLGEDIR
jgi:AAA15 family ATPase/GTPase